MQNIGQKYTHPAAASILLSLESVFGVAFSMIFYGETLTPRPGGWLFDDLFLGDRIGNKAWFFQKAANEGKRRGRYGGTIGLIQRLV